MSHGVITSLTFRHKDNSIIFKNSVALIKDKDYYSNHQVTHHSNYGVGKMMKVKLNKLSKMWEVITDFGTVLSIFKTKQEAINYRKNMH